MKSSIAIIAIVAAFSSTAGLAREPLAVELLGRNAVTQANTAGGAKSLVLVAKSKSAAHQRVAEVLGRGAPVLYSAAPQVTAKPMTTAKLVSTVQGRA